MRMICAALVANQCYCYLASAFFTGHIYLGHQTRLTDRSAGPRTQQILRQYLNVLLSQKLVLRLPNVMLARESPVIPAPQVKGDPLKGCK